MDTLAFNDAAFAAPRAEHTKRLLQFNDAVLAQLEALATSHEGPGVATFGALVGPHLRHVIEHYEALVAGRSVGEVDYDRRPRDRTLEQSPALARRRIAALRRALLDGSSLDPEEPLLVFTLGGLEGQWPLATASTLGRELIFLASHAVHHAALLREHLQRQGSRLPPQFGVAPATLAHARSTH